MKQSIYKFEGTVVNGKKLGRKLGFPTANLKINGNINLSYGVYVGSIYISNQNIMLKSVVNVGIHPSFPEGAATIEAYILDKNIDLYGENIIIYFYEKIRNEIKFDNVSDLSKQISMDVEYTRNFFK